MAGKMSTKNNKDMVISRHNDKFKISLKLWNKQSCFQTFSVVGGKGEDCYTEVVCMQCQGGGGEGGGLSMRFYSRFVCETKKY